jgi:hypothetical protein
MISIEQNCENATALRNNIWVVFRIAKLFADFC